MLRGQPAPLPLTLKGRVVGPSFHFSLDKVAFGTVSLVSAGSLGLIKPLTSCLI